MQCTSQEIEAKRKLALQKLADRKRKSSPQNSTPNGAFRIALQTPSDGKSKSSPQNTAPNGAFRSAPQTPSEISKHFSVKPAAEPNNFTAGRSETEVQNRYSPSNKQTFCKYSPYKKQQDLDKHKPVLAFQGKNAAINGKLALISSDRFSVVFSGFSTVAVEVMKSIPTRFYDPNTRVWNFHIKDYETLQTKMSVLRPDVTIDKLPPYILNCCHLKADESSGHDLSSIDPELVGALMPFQEVGVCFGIAKKGRCLIADDMGLGKTFQALAIANYYKTEWPLLIVTTATMRNVWEETIHKYLPTVPVMSVQYMVSGKDYIDDSQVLIVSHDLMSRHVDKLQDRNFNVIIIDESHNLKNFKTKCTKAATVLCKRARRVVLLSGTPCLSRPSELYSQLYLLDSKFFGTFFEYSKRYCDGKTTSFGWDASGQSNLQELEIVLAKKFMIRRTKDDVLKSLPNKTQEVVTLDVNLDQFSEDDRRCLLALAVKYNSVKKDHAVLLTFFAETAKIKIPSVCSYILQTLETGRKFLVFAHHQVMLNSIEQVLRKKKKKYIRIDGNTTCDQRKYFVDKFQLDDSYTCALLSITAANAGITLTAAQLVLFAELHWNPSILSQAESRAHRIGQEGQVTIQYLVAPGTADDSIWPLLQSKQKTLKEIGLTRDSYETAATKAQSKRPHEADLADCLNSSVTSANTLDITTYFNLTPKKQKIEEKASFGEELLNDDLDDVFSSVDF